MIQMSVRLQRQAVLMRQERYTVDEVSDLFGLGEAIVRRAVRTGRLQVIANLEGAVRFRRGDVFLWLRGDYRPVDTAKRSTLSLTPSSAAA